MPNETYLIDHWSFSSMKDFLGNRYKFLQKYVLKIWDTKTTPAMLIGSAGHEALEMILKGASVEHGIEGGLVLIENKPDAEIKWGKNGSREDVIKTFNFAIQAYLSEMPKMGTILAVEDEITDFIESDPEHGGSGERYPIPAKGQIDVVGENADGEFEIHDHKFVTAYTDSEKEKGNYILQAMFYYHLAWKKYGRRPVRAIFHECKTSENTSGANKGMPQVQDWKIEFAEYPQYFAFFYKLYDLCSTEIAKDDVVFLPNISDLMDGDETVKSFLAETMGVDKPTPIQHKTEDVAFGKEKRYVPSAADRVENASLAEREKIRLKFQEFGIAVEMREEFRGLNVVQYTFKPSRGVRMRDFETHEKDIAIALSASSVRIEAPIMGTDLVGVEVPNPERAFVELPVLDGSYVPDEFCNLAVPVGVDVRGRTTWVDLPEMPHLLVAGATGSGKSVFLNVLLKSLIRQNTPAQLGLVLIDPKRVELSGYNGDPHLLAKVIHETPQARQALLWLTDEMDRRYETLEGVGARNIDEYNSSNPLMQKIVVVVDEFADLMLQAKSSKAKGEPNLTEIAIVRLAQKARAVGIHLVLGTQRPSVDVVTGLIKANLPARIAFATTTRIESQIILDQSGAETLLGKGDLLFMEPGRRDLRRLQSFYV